jgi:curved DNA-binding protein CbpA
MAEPTPFNVSDAVKPNGFVDFYTLLGVSTDTTTDEIRSRINTLYSEAQANRDHRNLNKRREYQTLLEYLPQARTALLEEDKRAQYDQYAAQAASGSTTVDFNAFMGGLSGAAQPSQDRTDVLGVQDSGARAARTTTTASAGTATTTKKPRKSSSAARQRAGLMGSLISVIVFFVLLAIVTAVTGRFEYGLLAGAIAGAITWIVTHRGGGGVSV